MHCKGIVHLNIPFETTPRLETPIRPQEVNLLGNAGNADATVIVSRIAAHRSSKIGSHALCSKPATIGPPIGSHSATCSISPADARQTRAAKESTYAHFADCPSTEHRSACDPRRVSLLLIPDKWESEIRALGFWDDFGNIPKGLREGFCIGAASPVHTTHTPDNHKLAESQPLVISAHIQSELTAGCYTGPFS